MALRSFWYAEKLLACDCIGRYLCGCWLRWKLGVRPNFPTDPWFSTRELTFQVPQIAHDYEGPDKHLATEFVQDRILEQGGQIYGCCPGLRDACTTYNIVRDVKVDTHSGTVTVMVIAGQEDEVRASLRGLVDRSNKPITVFENLTAQPRARP